MYLCCRFHISCTCMNLIRYFCTGRSRYNVDNYFRLHIIAFLLGHIVGYSMLYSTEVLINNSLTFLQWKRRTFFYCKLFTILNRTSILFPWNIGNIMTNLSRFTVTLLPGNKFGNFFRNILANLTRHRFADRNVS